MGFNCGIVGLPNVGKTTIFNALTGLQCEVSNYSFSTTKPFPGNINVPDERLDKIDDVIKAEKKVYTTMEVVDMPGLAKGASHGEGLGNKFLNDIRKVDALIHVVRCFDDENVLHPNDTIDPVRDSKFVNIELIMADLELVEKQIERTEKLAKSGNPDAKAKLEVYSKIQKILYDEKPLRNANISADELKHLKDLNLITFKPVLYVANVSDDFITEDNDYVNNLREYVKTEGGKLVKISGKIEAEISELEEDEKKEFLADLNLKEPSLNLLAREGYALLNLVTFFTVGGKENRAWTIYKNDTAFISAGKIHSDIQRGFIRAEVYNYVDLLTYKSEVAIKEKGLFRLEGKDYIVKDGDVLHFRFNV